MSPALELRPHHALCGVIFVFAVAGASLGRLAAAGSGSSTPPIVREVAPPPAYEILDAAGRVLARSVERLDLVMSPNAMWQAHTPEFMAARISEATGGVLCEAELLQAMFPDAAKQGFVRVKDPRLQPWQAARIEEWARTGSIAAGHARTASSAAASEADSDEFWTGIPFDGLWVEETLRGFELCWDPLTTLSLAERSRHGFRKYPLPWTRHVADQLARCLWGSESLAVGADHRALEQQRQRVWSMLLPCQHVVVARQLDPRVAPNLYWTLVEEGVAAHQMRVERGNERVHPAGEWELLGNWGFPSQPRAELLVAQSWGVSDPESIPARWQSDFQRAVREVLSRRHPSFGLESVAAELAADCFPSGVAQPAAFAYRRDKPARQRTRAYYYDAQPAGDAIQVVTTLDLELCRSVGQILDAALSEHDAALAQAIVVDVPTGDVLAVDAKSAYSLWGFAPVAHRFTPGSTFKAVVMAAALDDGLVTPTEPIDVGFAPLPLEDDRGRTLRRIREAESAVDGVLTATECLAHSSNRGMTQIGLRLDPRAFRERLVALGYGQVPSIELGSERRGFLPALPWKRLYTHASLCFGHELTTTLWQHTEALTTIVRGGERLPLRLFREVGHEQRVFELLPEEGQRIFDPRTCAEVRAMMQVGASEGTGRSVASPEHLPGLTVGTKTGTAEKVPTEICLHAELTHLADGHACSAECRRTLMGERVGHSTCYTSSMALFAQDPASGRELFVLVVVDEPRGEAKYGSRVAGPSAVRILEEALGRTRHGQLAASTALPGFRLGARESQNTSTAPWSEGEW